MGPFDVRGLLQARYNLAMTEPKPDPVLEELLSRSVKLREESRALGEKMATLALQLQALDAEIKAVQDRNSGRGER